MRLTSKATMLDFDPFKTRTNADGSQNLGDMACLTDGRIFRYAKVGASNAAKGQLQLAPAHKTNHDNIAVAAAAASGAKQVTVTLGATAATLDEYAEGFLAVNDVDGEGQTYSINGHAAANLSTSLVVNLFDPIATALTTNSQVCLVHNSYNGVIVGTAATQLPAGVPLVAIAAGDYGWVQSRGVAAVLADETLTLGFPVVAGSSTAGAVEEQDGTFGTAQAQYVVGKAFVAGVDTEYRPVMLTID